MTSGVATRRTRSTRSAWRAEHAPRADGGAVAPGVPILEIAALAIDFFSFGTHPDARDRRVRGAVARRRSDARRARDRRARLLSLRLGHEEAGKAHTADESYKAYAAEAQRASASRIMLLLAVQSWFDWDSHDGFATWGWASQLGVGAVALYHLVYALGFASLPPSRSAGVWRCPMPTTSRRIKSGRRTSSPPRRRRRWSSMVWRRTRRSVPSRRRRRSGVCRPAAVVAADARLAHGWCRQRRGAGRARQLRPARTAGRPAAAGDGVAGQLVVRLGAAQGRVVVGTSLELL